MNRIYYAERDTTIYEQYPERNTGIDEILELEKITSGSVNSKTGLIDANTYNSRILIDFGSEITSLGQSIADGKIPTLDTGHVSSGSVFLNLHASDASDLLQSYTIKVYPISESWDNGAGYDSDTPTTKVGSSWFNRSGDAVAQNGIAWNVSDAHSENTSAGTSNELGGGTWITGSGYEASQSFQNQSPDIRIDVTDVVKQWVNSNISNNGFIIKRPYSDEINGDLGGSIKFFGRESHTIFVPKLEVCWDDQSITSTTGISSNTYIPYFKNIKPEYRTTEEARFRLGVRPEFPNKSYATSSFYITEDILPISSSYEIIDSVTNDVIIKDEKIFSNSTTKISNDGDGNFFNLRMDSFMPERYYKIKLTCRRTYDVQTFDDFYFKVVN
tara:strand:- start:10919 stop:12076 length:1158 start_codon:yes stop_codon:yes gene_type:complete